MTRHPGMIIWQTQPVATLLHALKGRTLVPFNLG